MLETARTNYERVKFAHEANQRWEKAKETLSFRRSGSGESDAKKNENNNNSSKNGGGIVSKEDVRMADESDIAIAARRGCDFGSSSPSASTTIQTTTREERRQKDIFYRAKACERFDDLGGRGQLFACFVVQPAHEENVLCVVDGKGRTMWREEMSERLAERRRAREDGGKLRAGEVVDVGAYQCRITSEGEEDGPFEYSISDGEGGKTTSSEYGSGESSSACFSSSEDEAERTKRKPPPPPEMVVELKVNEKTGKLQPPPGYALVAKPEYDEFGIAIEHPGVEYEPQNWWQYFWGYAKVPKPLEVTHKQRKGGEVLSSSSSSSSSSSRRRRSTLKAGEEYRKERDDNTETTIKKEKKEKTKWMRDGWPGKSEGKPRPRPFTDEEVEQARFELLSREAEARQTASKMETRAKLEAAKAAEAALEAAKAALKVKEAALANAKVQEAVMRAEQARTAVMMAKEAERLAKVALVSTLPTHKDYDNAQYATRNVNLATREEFERLYGLEVNATNYPVLEAYRKAYEHQRLNMPPSSTSAAPLTPEMMASAATKNNNNSAIMDSLKWLAKGGPLQQQQSDQQHERQQRPTIVSPKVDPAVFAPVTHEFQKFMPQPAAAVPVFSPTVLEQQQEQRVPVVATTTEHPPEKGEEDEGVDFDNGRDCELEKPPMKNESISVKKPSTANGVKVVPTKNKREKKLSRKEKEKVHLLAKIAALEQEAARKGFVKSGKKSVPIIEHKKEDIFSSVENKNKKQPTASEAVVVQDREKCTQKEVSLVKSRAQFFAFQKCQNQHRINDDDETSKRPLSTTEKARLEIEAASAGLSVADRAKRVANNFKPKAQHA